VLGQNNKEEDKRTTQMATYGLSLSLHPPHAFAERDKLNTKHIMNKRNNIKSNQHAHSNRDHKKQRELTVGHFCATTYKTRLRQRDNFKADTVSNHTTNDIPVHSEQISKSIKNPNRAQIHCIHSRISSLSLSIYGDDMLLQSKWGHFILGY